MHTDNEATTWKRQILMIYCLLTNCSKCKLRNWKGRHISEKNDCLDALTADKEEIDKGYTIAVSDVMRRGIKNSI